MAGAPSGTTPMVMEVASVKYYAPASNTSGVFPPTAPVTTVTWRAPYATMGPSSTIGVNELIPLGTVLADFSGATTYSVRGGDNRFGVIGSTLVVADLLDYETWTTHKLYVGGASATSGFGYIPPITINIINEVDPVTAWWNTTATIDLDFEHNRFHGGGIAAWSDVIAVAGGGAVPVVTGGLQCDGATLSAAGILKTLIASTAGSVQIIFTGYAPGATAGLLSPSPAGTEWSSRIIISGDLPTTSNVSAALGTGSITGRTGACLGWDTTGRLLAANGGAAVSTFPLAPVSDCVVGRSAFGDGIFTGRIARIIMWPDASLASAATITARSAILS